VWNTAAYEETPTGISANELVLVPDNNNTPQQGEHADFLLEANIYGSTIKVGWAWWGAYSGPGGQGGYFNVVIGPHNEIIEWPANFGGVSSGFARAFILRDVGSGTWCAEIMYISEVGNSQHCFAGLPYTLTNAEFGIHYYGKVNGEHRDEFQAEPLDAEHHDWNWYAGWSGPDSHTIASWNEPPFGIGASFSTFRGRGGF
jgi:hypothetical protein